jgi:AcrR family transcriptional regulator
MPIEVRREQVLDAALALTGRDGYRAVTMEAVSREAEIAKPVVYNAYPGRESLLAALLEREQGKALAALAEAMPAGGADPDPAVAMRDWLHSLARAVAANPVAWRLMLLPGSETPEPVRERVEAGRALALGQVAAITESLIDARPELAGIDRELAAEAVLGAAESCARLLIADPQRWPPERLVAFGDAVLGAFGPSRLAPP